MAGYLLEFCVIILILLPVYLLVRRPWKRWSRREAALAVFVLFIAGLLVLALQGEYASPGLMFQRARQRLESGIGINLVPFRSIASYFLHYGWDNFLVNFFGNIVMFMPWGFGLTLLWKRNQRMWRVLVYSLALTLLIETIQLFIGRSVDVDDLILNFAGSCLGAVLYFVLRKKFPVFSEFAWPSTQE